MSIRHPVPRAFVGAASLWLHPLLRTGGVVAAATLASSAFACATPFAALATWAALTLPRREGIALVTSAWLTNQVIGFGLHAYPHDLATYAWGLAIGIGALTALPAAFAVARRARSGPILCALAALVTAFAAYEAVLYVAAFVLPGGSGAYAPAIVLRLFLINAGALAGLALVQVAGTFLVSGRRQALVA